MTHRRLSALLLVPAALALALLPASAAMAATGSFTAEATGANEVEGGDEDASATGSLTADSDAGEFCHDVEAEGLDDAQGMHIHVGEEGVNGDIVIDLGVEGINGGETCTDAEAGLLEEIIGNPAGYYLNIHTPEFPGGAVRGQLMESGDADPDSVGAGSGGMATAAGTPLLAVLLLVTGAAVVAGAGWRLARR